MELAVVFIKPPVGAAHGHVAGPAGLQAPALGFPRLPAENAPAPAATQLLSAGRRQPIVAGKPCQTHRHRGSAAGTRVGSRASFVALSGHGERGPIACGAEAWGLWVPDGGGRRCQELRFYG